jgi:glycogen operon protein
MIRRLRARQQRNFLATLFLSLGTPMLLGGDEMGRTQGGNNNAWCQDSEISWFDWDLGDEQQDLLAFTRRLIELRQEHPAFRRTRFLKGEEVHGSGLPDVWWFRPDGRRMTTPDWTRPDAHVLGVFLNGDELLERDARGNIVTDDSFLLLLNAHHEDVEFLLPSDRFGKRWVVELTTADKEERQRGKEQDARGPVAVMERSLLLMRRIA